MSGTGYGRYQSSIFPRNPLYIIIMEQQTVHFRNICRGDKLYINVGSLGCPSKEHDVARAGVLNIEDGKADIEPVDVRYDVDEVIRQIDDLNYPEADVVKRIFYGL